MDGAANSILWRKLHDPKSMTPRVQRWPPSQSQQFPSKYTHLPHIGQDSPRPGSENQLVALRNSRKSSPGFGGYRPNMDGDTEERIRQLEVRLGVSEKSNRALLEEVLRLQNDLRNTTKKSESILGDEREARKQLEAAIRISNELINQLSQRIRETEDKIDDEKSNLNTLFSHTKNVEKTVLSGQHELQARKDDQSMRLHELRAELNETKQSRSQVEQLTFQLSEELRSLRAKVDNQQAEFTNMVSDVRSRARKLEEDNRLHLDSIRKQSDLHSMSDVQTTQLKGQVETRLAELRDVLMDLRSKQEAEQTERRNLEKSMQTRLGELYNSVSEQSRKREENMHTVDMVMREKDHASQAERLQLTAKVTDTVEDVNKRLLAKEMKIREDIQTKFLQLEKLIQREQTSRQDYEKAAREDADRRWQTLKRVLEEEMNITKETMSMEKGKNRDTASKLDQSISIVEKQLSENKKQMDKILAAEIKSRKLHESSTNDKIDTVNQKLQVATSSLQQAIGGVSQHLTANNDKVRTEVKSLLNDQHAGSTRALSDMDARLVGLKQKILNMENQLDAKVASASQSLGERLNDRLDAVTKWQDATGDTLRELGRSVQTIPQDVYQMEEKFKLMKSEMDSRVSHESDARAREVEELRHELQNLKGRLDRQPKPASLQDLEAKESEDEDEEMNVGVRKLADNLQTVKTVLGMKIQSEQKLRISGLEDLQSQINQLKIMTGSSLKYSSVAATQFEDLDTGLGWDDLATYGTNTGTPSTSYDQSRQHFSDQYKPKTQPIREATREMDSPFETKGGLKNMNIPSPTPKSQDDEGIESSRQKSGRQSENANVNSARKTPGDVTPENWDTPRDGGKTPESIKGRESAGRATANPTPASNKTPSRKTTPKPKTPTDDTTGKQSRQNSAGAANTSRTENQDTKSTADIDDV